MQLFFRTGRRYRAATPQDILDAAAAVTTERERGVVIGSPVDASALCRSLCGAYDHERFGVVWLDNRHRVLHAEAIFRGTIDGAVVYPRVMVQRALELNAAAVIVSHNHPSGVAEPSGDDVRITKRLRDALALVDIRLLDHLVIAGDDVVSLAAKGVL